MGAQGTALDLVPSFKYQLLALRVPVNFSYQPPCTLASASIQNEAQK